MTLEPLHKKRVYNTVYNPLEPLAKPKRHYTRHNNILHKYIRFHNSHIVRCPRCKSVLLIIGKTVVNVDDSTSTYYRCMDCNTQFTCCPKNGKFIPPKKTVSRYSKRIKTLKLRIKHYENLIRENSI